MAGFAKAGPGGSGVDHWADAMISAAGALAVARADVRMRVVRRRIDSGASETDAARRADVLLDLLLAVTVVAVFGWLGGFALHINR